MKNIFKYFICLICILILFFIFISFVFYSSDKELGQEMSLYQRQNIIDKTINLYDFTLDNPSIINNPYEISPLTSLVIFNTNDYCSPVVTVYGKNNDDFVYRYEESKIHYLIIYGLYSNYNNKVKIMCGSKEKIVNIETDKLPDDILYKELEYDNKLNFVSSNYLYAVDKDNEIRWILTDKYNGNINILSNNNLIVSGNEVYSDNSFVSVVEMNLLGKLYNVYYVKNNGNIVVDDNYIYIDDKKMVDRQTGEVCKINSNLNTVNGKLNDINSNFKLKNIIVFNDYENTLFINKNMSLFNSKKIDEEYKKYDIKINRVNDRLVVEGNFKENEVYLILESTFDNKMIKLDNNINYIYNNELNEKYNIYLKINKKLYKTDYYVDYRK